MLNKTTTLYRPVGLTEYKLIQDSGYQRFPPRLDWQPIFYPVLNEKYACEIAQQWNTKDAFSGHIGIVTAFEIPTHYFNTFEVQNVGGTLHNELWVPAHRLDTFNQNIVGIIKVTQVFYGASFTGEKINLNNDTITKK